MTQQETGPVKERWTVQKIIAFLHELAYFERACAHILAGWNPKIPELDVKIAFGKHLYQDMDHATQLRNRLWALSRLVGEDPVVPEGWRTIMIQIDAVENTAQLLLALYLVIKRHLLELYIEFLANTDPIADAPSVRFISRIIPEEKEQFNWANQVVERLSQIYNLGHVSQNIEELWLHRNTVEQLNLSESIWSPLDRVPQVVRPANMQRGEPGALRIIPLDSLRNPKDIGIFLHGFLNEEFTTMELICRNSYEHPDMPWQFHLDMGRHAADEGRHAQILERLAADYGVTYGDYPIYTYSYDGQYQFDPCEPGSKKELLWRILLRQTFHEGLALDSLSFEVRKREFLGQPELARVFSFLLADEIFHAQSGLKWSRYLCGEDAQKAMHEREAAHEYFIETVKRRRARFVAYNMEKAVAEIELLEEAQKYYQLPFHRTVDMRSRQVAGFLDEEIQQAIEWGYVSPS